MSAAPAVEPSLGDILGTALRYADACERERSDRLSAQARYVSAWELADDLAAVFAVTPGEVFDALCTVPDNMLSLLDYPEGWTALGGYIAADFGVPIVTYRPTVH